MFIDRNCLVFPMDKIIAHLLCGISLLSEKFKFINY